MSCIIGLKYGGHIYMGSDGIATTEDGDYRPIICNKIFTNGKYLIGYCGSVRTGQLLYPHYFEPPDNILDFPTKIRENFMENGCLLSGDPDSGDRNEANFLIAKLGTTKLYEMLSDFQISEVIDFTSIGSGSHFAFGSLETTKLAKKIKPSQRILIALNAASKYCRSVGPPFTIKVI